MVGEQLADVGAWCSILGLLVGLLGFGAAVWAALSAKGAREAARAATRAVRWERGRDELLDLLGDTGRLVDALRADNLWLAHQLAGRLSERFHVWRSRNEGVLGLTTEPGTQQLQIGLRGLADRMGTAAGTPADRVRVAERCRAHLAKLVARLQQDMDRESQEDG